MKFQHVKLHFYLNSPSYPTKARLCAQALCILHCHKSHSTGGCMDEHLLRRGTMTAVSAAYLQGIFFGGCRDTKFPKMYLYIFIYTCI